MDILIRDSGDVDWSVYESLQPVRLIKFCGVQNRLIDQELCPFHTGDVRPQGQQVGLLPGSQPCGGNHQLVVLLQTLDFDMFNVDISPLTGRVSMLASPAQVFSGDALDAMSPAGAAPM